MQSSPIINDMSGTISVTGIGSLQRALNRLPDELQKGGESAALRGGAKPITKAARAKAPQDSGQLRKSIGYNVKTIKGKRTARVGARKGWKAEVTRNGRTVTADPSKYIHLVELGTSHSAAQPFIRPAVESTRGEVINAMADGLDKYIGRAIKRIRSKR
jgi:HK97 gp10 family phage protein